MDAANQARQLKNVLAEKAIKQRMQSRMTKKNLEDRAQALAILKTTTVCSEKSTSEFCSKKPTAIEEGQHELENDQMCTLLASNDPDIVLELYNFVLNHNAKHKPFTLFLFLRFQAHRIVTVWKRDTFLKALEYCERNMRRNPTFWTRRYGVEEGEERTLFKDYERDPDLTKFAEQLDNVIEKCVEHHAILIQKGWRRHTPTETQSITMPLPEESNTQTKLTRNAKADDYTLKALLTAGRFVAVWKAQNKKNKDEVVIKMQRHIGDEISEEVEIMRRLLGSPTAIQYRDSFVHLGKLWIVMNQCEMDGQQFVATRNYEERLEINALIIFSGIAKGIRALRNLGDFWVCHRDIKLKNAVLCEDGVKLIDFGLSKLLAPRDETKGCKTYVGTPPFMSPEIHRAKEYGEYGIKTDVWSLGITLSELLFRSVPYPEAATHIEIGASLLEDIGNPLLICTKELQNRFAQSRNLEQFFVATLQEQEERSSIDEICKMEVVLPEFTGGLEDIPYYTLYSPPLYDSSSGSYRSASDSSFESFRSAISFELS